MGIRKFIPSLAIAALVIGTSVSTYAEPLVNAGNAILRPATLEKIIRGSIADVLDARVNNNSMTFTLPAISQTVSLPAPTGILKEVLGILGIQNTLAVGISPIQTAFTLPDGGLKLTITQRATNSFLISAKWSLTALTAKSDTLAIKVPAGMFDRAFEIHSRPVQIALKSGSVPIQFSIQAQADLGDAGAKIKLKSFTTNINSEVHPDFAIKLGQLSVEGQPLVLQIQSNGQTLTADEPTIRAEFQKLEASYAETIRQKLSDVIESQTEVMARSIAEQRPFKFDSTTDELLANLSVSSDVHRLFRGIDLSFIPSYLQTVHNVNVDSAQISAKICFDGQCLSNLGPVSAVGSADLHSMVASDDLGIVVYESLLQSIIHSAAFQKRIATYYANSAATPGVGLSESGIKIYLDPAKNALLAVVNLEIDIKKTTPANASLVTRLTNNFADWWEARNGSGKLVKIPVAVDFKLMGMGHDSSGSYFQINSQLISFAADGSYTAPPRCSETDCPNNIPSMHDFVRTSLLADVKKQISKAVPSVIKIPMSASFNLKNFSFSPKNLIVTTNRGLMLTAGMKALSNSTTTGVRP
jgi:hypothetical protein